VDTTQAVKVESPVRFPETNLSISSLQTKELGVDGLEYELYACICHTGGLHGGHYTSYTKVGEDWYHQNDESVKKVSCPVLLLKNELAFFMSWNTFVNLYY
jgi:ubiquitin C-terminal hydrolase